MNIFKNVIFFIVITVFVGNFFASCVSIPGTSKKALILISPRQEQAMGLTAYNQIIQKEKLSTNHKWNQMLQRVGRRIANVVPVKNFDWRFTLIENKLQNAFCLPGGKVAFYTGIMPILQNEAGMAIVMGHEIAHAVARHGAQRVSQGMLAQIGMLGAGILSSNSKHRNKTMALLGVGLNVGVMLPFSRSNETEADTLGIDYAAKAGYDPREGPSFWQRFSAETSKGGRPPAFLSTHPTGESRVRNLQALIPQAMINYNNSAKYGLGENI